MFVLFGSFICCFEFKLAGDSLNAWSHWSVELFFYPPQLDESTEHAITPGDFLKIAAQFLTVNVTPPPFPCHEPNVIAVYVTL